MRTGFPLACVNLLTREVVIGIKLANLKNRKDHNAQLKGR
jgi:hypothetical protein